MRRLLAAALVTLGASFVLLASGCRAGDFVPRNTACERAWVVTGKAEDIGLWIPEDLPKVAKRHCDDDVAAADEVSWNRSYPDDREAPHSCATVTSEPATDDPGRLTEARCVGDWADYVEYMDERPRSCVEPANMETQQQTSTARYRELVKICSADVSAKANEPSFGQGVLDALSHIAIGIAGLLLLYGLFKGAWSD
ncbi:hypothetical protein [Micromonospora sp. NPDC023888]|uniref:hypothetical protein n=1 Tax=Micromonospora sp. NPDC023888 TaxID=3155607 RepID=UPI00340EB399